MSDEIQPSDPSGPLIDVFGLPHTLRSWRAVVGWSQEDLERISGVSQKTISDIESGRKDIKPQDNTLRKFADAFAEATDVKPGALFKALKDAREHRPDVKVSDFAQRLDTLLSGEPPARRLFLEQSLMDHYYAQKRALEFANRSVTKKPRRSNS